MTCKSPWIILKKWNINVFVKRIREKKKEARQDSGQIETQTGSRPKNNNNTAIVPPADS